MEDKMMAAKAGKEEGKRPTAAAPSASTSEMDDLSEVKPKGLSQAGKLNIEYYDPGSHWCKCCNFVAFKLYGYLEHLQTSSHMKVGETSGEIKLQRFTAIKLTHPSQASQGRVWI